MAQAVKYTMGKDFVHVIMPGIGAFALEASHETFPAMKRALLKKQWARVPHLINLARQLGYQTQGQVTIEKGIPFYKGTKMEGYLGTLLAETVRRGKNSELPSLLKFANNVYQNPDPKTRDEVYQFLELSKMPRTDDGCFLAYKCVRADFTDCHTGKYDNTPGETPAMPRKAVNSNTREACSSGFHFAALDYIRDGFGSKGNRVVMIKINPRDVVAIPEYKDTLKGRTWYYEVVKELMTVQEAKQLQDHPEMLMHVVTLDKERKGLLKQILTNPAIKRAIRRGTIKKSTIVKQTYARLVKMASKFTLNSPQLEVKVAKVLSSNPLKSLREKAGLTVGQVAKATGMSYKAVWGAEKAKAPTQETIDKYLETINKLSGKPDHKKYSAAMAASASSNGGSSYANPVHSSLDDDDADDDYSDGYEYDGEE